MILVQTASIFHIKAFASAVLSVAVDHWSPTVFVGFYFGIQSWDWIGRFGLNPRATS